MGREFHFKGFSVVRSDMRCDVSLARFSRQYHEAQLWLDFQVMQDMVPFMPLVTGTFIKKTRTESTAIAGSGRVMAAAPPMGRYLYMGKVMVEKATGNGPMNLPGLGLRFHKGAKLKATDRPINTRGKWQPHWFDPAKERYGKDWIAGVKQRAGGG